jgi:phosphoesterase RecJ-like protein
MQYGPVIDFLSRNRKFVITAHETPDGDALGSEFAMQRALAKLGKSAFICNADPAPEKFTFVEPDQQPLVLQNGSQLPPDLGERALLILDVNDLNNLGSVGRLVVPRVREYFIIDHHDSDADLLAPNHIEQGASSTCEILYLLFRAMRVEMDFHMAQALYMGIVYDTGCFIYPKTTAVTFQIAHELVGLGVSPNQVYANVFESNSLSSLVLMSRVLSTLTLHEGGRVAARGDWRPLRGRRPPHQHPAAQPRGGGLDLLQGKRGGHPPLLHPLQGQHRRGRDRAGLRRGRPPHRRRLQVLPPLRRAPGGDPGASRGQVFQFKVTP